MNPGIEVSTKRAFRRKWTGFTLAELIVVITILAILATIGFLALSGYSQDAKDSVIKANVRSVQTAISSEAAITWNSPRFYVVHDSGAALSGAFVYVDGDQTALTGWDWNVSGTNYSAGNPDYAKLKLNRDKFKVGYRILDSVTASYDSKYLSVGAMDAVSKSPSGGKPRSLSYFQVAGISPVTGAAVVTGNYPASSGSVAGLVKNPTSSSSTGALMDGSSSSNVSNVPPVNGSCWTASGSSVPGYPSSGLCSAGNAVTVDSDGSDGAFNWNCAGTDGGTSASCAATKVPYATCLAVKTASPSSADGTYLIDPDGIGGTAAFTTYCDMTTDGGGWTLAGYSYAWLTATDPSNQNFHSLKCGGGTFNPASRGTSSAAIAALPLAKASTEVAFSISTGGSSVTTGNMNAYSTAYKFAIPNPSQLTFDNHSYLWSSWSTTAGSCVAVSVSTIKGTAWSGTRYTKANSLGTSWTDSYPTGYGAVDNSSCVQNWDYGIFVTSIHTGHGNASKNGTQVTECDVSQGSLTYAYRGLSTHNGTNVTGSAAIWFR